jgi:spore coat polysaccharide biosynthesis protein SpsF
MVSEPNYMNIAFIQAREKSNRLPKKVLQKIVGKTIIEHVIDRVQRSKLIDRVIVLTGNIESNNGITSLCREIDIDVFNGSDNDVLSRFVDALNYYGLPNSARVIRITADCPFIDPDIIDYAIQEHIKSNLKYSNTSLENLLPDGLDVEVINAGLLKEIEILATETIDREHVTHFIYSKNFCEVNNIGFDRVFPNIRLTLDYEEDLILIHSIYENLYYKHPEFTIDDILNLYQKDEELFQINLKYSRNEGLKLTNTDEHFQLSSLSKLSIGTANLGMKYGYFNDKNKLDPEEFIKIIQLSKEYGIYNIDTASAYGDSEAILGDLSIHLNGFNVSGKYSGEKLNEKGKLISPTEEAKNSLEKLNRSQFYCYYYHNPKHMYDSSITNDFKNIKDLGLSKLIGVSVYETEDAIYAINEEHIDVIQIKYNLFDFNIMDNEVIRLAKKKGKEIYVRSIFLQGLLLANIDSLPEEFAEFKSPLIDLDQIARDYSLTRLELLLFFVFMNSDIEQILIGVNSYQHFNEIINASKNIRPNRKLYEKLKYFFKDFSSILLNPINWSKQ